MKTCTKCAKDWPEEYFFITDKKSGRRRGDCKFCVNERTKRLREANPEKTAEIRLAANRKHKYGVTRQDVYRMLEENGGTCAICPTVIDYMSAHVDHCHDTGKVRGLLCKTCNWGIGHFKNDVEYLRKAILYLER